MKELKPEERSALATFYSTMAEQLDSRLSESPKFFGVILAALTAYGYVISTWKPGTSRFLLVLVSLISYIVILWAIWYVAALGYAFRFLQYPMHQAEKVLGWETYTIRSGEVPKSCSLHRYFWLLPGIYHAHLGGLVAIMAIVCFVFAFKWWNTEGAFGCPHSEALSSSSIGFFLGLLWTVAINNRYVNKYEDKERALENEKTKKE